MITANARLEKELKAERRKSIQSKIANVSAWLYENNVSDKNWDENVRELNWLEVQLEIIDAPQRKSSSVDYEVSLMVTIPNIQ
jgi:hypothetical protein